MWNLTKGYRLSFAIAIGSMAVGYMFMFGVPLVAKFSIDAILAPQDMAPADWLLQLARSISTGDEPGIVDYLVLAALATVSLTAVAGALLYLRGRFASLAAEAIIRRLRDQVFNHLEHLPSRYHDKADTGDLVQRCTSDMETVRVFLSAQVIEINRALLMLIVVMPILFSMHVLMAWLSLAIMPFLFIAAYLFFQRVKSLFTIVDEAEAELTTVLQENLTGIRVVRAFARQSFEIDKFALKNAAFREHNKRLMALLGAYYSFSDIICLGQIGLLLIIGANWVSEGSLSVGTLFAFLTYEGMIIWPIRHMGRVLTDSGKAIVAIGRLSEILSEPMESQDEYNPGQRLTGQIRFDKVTFAYDSLTNVLNGVSFHIKPGQTLALLGPPGCGKSTITQLLLRLYDYELGSIKLDDWELQDLNRKFVRSQISIVLQEPFLYSASIAANLQIGRMDATFEEIRQAAMDACIHESIEGFPRGYDAMVGERGVTLSGGQRQRLALARALLKNPPILILDDSLSSVDTDTESHILQSLKKRRHQQTTIIIAHRLSSVMHADKILMLNNGQVVQEGNHDQLLSEPGVYRQLCEIQGAIQRQIDLDVSTQDAADMTSEKQLAKP